MSLRDAYRQKLAAQVEEQRARLGALKAHAKRVAADGRIIGYEELVQAERSLGQFASKLKRVAGASLHALADVRGGVGKALDDLTVSTKRAAGRLSEVQARSKPSRRTRRTARKARPAKRQRAGGRAGVPPRIVK
jgi:hypothetical protein